MIVGKVIHGDGRGKSQGYATANLELGRERTLLEAGCYAAWAEFHGYKHSAALIVGAQAAKVEVYLLDYVGPDFYGEEITVDPIKKVSEVMHVNSFSHLKAKMDQDIVWIRSVLAGE